MAVCGSPLRNKPGKFCQIPIVMENGRCYLHGGPTLRGIAAPAFKHGRLSKFMPKTLSQRYNVALTDENLLGLNDEIATLVAREEELFASLSRIDGPTTSEQLSAVWVELSAARDRKDTGGLQSALTRIGDLIQEGAAEQDKWRDIVKVFHDKKALVESERRRQVELRQMVAIDEIMVFMRAILYVIREGITVHVRDKSDATAALTFIQSETNKLLSHNAAVPDLAPADTTPA